MPAMHPNSRWFIYISTSEIHFKQREVKALDTAGFCLQSETKLRNEAHRNGWNEWVNVHELLQLIVVIVISSMCFSNSWPKTIYFSSTVLSVLQWWTHPDLDPCQAHARSSWVPCRMVARRRWSETSRWAQTLAPPWRVVTNLLTFFWGCERWPIFNGWTVLNSVE